MKNLVKLQQIVWLCALTFGLASCQEDCVSVSGDYQFTLPTTLQPAKTTYKIGDTIYVKSQFDDRLYEAKSRLHLHLPNFRFNPATEIVRLDSSINAFDALKYFTIIIDTTQFDYRAITTQTYPIARTAMQLMGEYTYKNAQYTLEYKLIPQRAGTYMLTQMTDKLLYTYSRWNVSSFPQQCKGTGIDFTYIINNDSTRPNLDYLRASTDTIWRTRGFTNYFDQKNNYCFVVTP
jgi:hypothetical protein